MNMDQQKLLTRYRTYGNEKLLESYCNRQDYSPQAIAAMETVILERGLQPEQENIFAEERRAQEQQTIALKAAQKQYEGQMLKPSPFWSFADIELNETAEHLEWNMLNGRYRALRVLLGGLALSAAVIWLVFLWEGGAPEGWLEYTGGSALLLGLVTAWLTRQSRTRVYITRQGGLKEFGLKQGTYQFWAEAPFTYFVYWYQTEHKAKMVKVQVPTLALGITNARNETVILQGDLTGLDAPPPAWPHISEVDIPARARIYTEIAMRRVNIIRLKKILEERGYLKNQP